MDQDQHNWIVELYMLTKQRIEAAPEGKLGYQQVLRTGVTQHRTLGTLPSRCKLFSRGPLHVCFQATRALDGAASDLVCPFKTCVDGDEPLMVSSDLAFRAHLHKHGLILGFSLLSDLRDEIKLLLRWNFPPCGQGEPCPGTLALEHH